ncbi:hypothetical protein GYH30_016263 [Glycine max]|nr:hypothetical protein GYH30_016263 [Glycine max]
MEHSWPSIYDAENCISFHFIWGKEIEESDNGIWPEFLASSTGKEFVAGEFGGIADIISGYPLDTFRMMQQSSNNGSAAFTILRNLVAKEGPTALYRGMASPLASVTLQLTN